jgi:hypothetical protein
MLALGFSDITTSGAICVILIVFVAFGFIKGLVRTAFTLVALTAGILAGLWGFQKGASIAGTLISDPDPWMSAAVGILLGLAIFFVARALFGVLLSPVGAKDGKANKLAIPGSLLGFLMGCAFAWFCLSGIRYIGTLAELGWLRAAIADETKIEKIDQPFFSKLKRGLDTSGPGQFHEKFDFLNDRARANLAKLTVLVDSKLAVTRAAIDKDVREAVLQEGINAMLLKQSVDLKSYIDSGQFSHLLHSKVIKEASQDEEVSATLANIDIEKALGLLEEKKDKDDEEDKK